MRVNEVFGDVVAWDLVPTFAAEHVELLPGANPMFGLNTLGGALALNTRSGFDSERFDLTLEAGSFGRRAAELGAGAAHSAPMTSTAGSSAVAPSRRTVGATSRPARCGRRWRSSLIAASASGSTLRLASRTTTSSETA